MKPSRYGHGTTSNYVTVFLSVSAGLALVTSIESEV